MASELRPKSAFDAQNADRDELLAELDRSRTELDHLRGALESNRQIGAATGILMALRGLTQAQAFDLLRQASQHTHRKLRDVAAEVLLTGVLPDLRISAGGAASQRERSQPAPESAAPGMVLRRG